MICGLGYWWGDPSALWANNKADNLDDYYLVWPIYPIMGWFCDVSVKFLTVASTLSKLVSSSLTAELIVVNCWVDMVLQTHCD